MRVVLVSLCCAALLVGCVRSGANVTPKGAVAAAQPVGGLSASIAPEVNAFRAANGKAPLAADARLARAAQAHASDMARKGYFNHTGKDGSSVGDRVKRQGYGFCFVAENIAQGQSGATQALAGWQKSEGHRKNLLSGNAIHFGMAEANGYWVMVLGKTGC
ncbi:MAG: CAP domain-containing protein [Planktotalea sp.]|uniref:CAP domain-containing protein n=1 Tax=Planktotalea sp. TaxID=2029877 RepID=UPI003C786D17